MFKFIAGGFIIWLTAWIGWEIVKYNYSKRIRPYMNDFIYKLEAIYELHKIRVEVKAKELKIRDSHPIEVVDDHKPRCWEWSTNYENRAGEVIYTTELIEDVFIDNNN